MQRIIGRSIKEKNNRREKGMISACPLMDSYVLKRMPINLPMVELLTNTWKTLDCMPVNLAPTSKQVMWKLDGSFKQMQTLTITEGWARGYYSQRNAYYSTPLFSNISPIILLSFQIIPKLSLIILLISQIGITQEQTKHKKCKVYCFHFLSIILQH